MMRSLYSGVTGLRTHQLRMDVIGNNLANVNTYGFKSSRVTFKDILYQTISNPAKASTDDPIRSGTNPYQVGYGVQLGSIDVLNTRAGYSMTDAPFDCYIDGEGYFKVSDPSGNEYYTRVGAFNFDAAGYLHDTNGSIVYGALGDETISDGYEAVPLLIPDVLVNYSSVSIGRDGVITGINNETQQLEKLGTIAVYKFPNNDGLVQYGNTYLKISNNSGDPVITQPGSNGTGQIITGGLEMSNVDLSREFTDMIVTQRGFQANAKIITTSDEMLQDLVNLKR